MNYYKEIMMFYWKNLKFIEEKMNNWNPLKLKKIKYIMNKK